MDEGMHAVLNTVMENLDKGSENKHKGHAMQAITPFLWFDNNAEEATQFYTSIFKNSRITGITRYGDGGPGTAGTVMTTTFQLDGQEFMALNGGPHFKFTEAISFMVRCETQADIDRLWEKLSAGGKIQQCGWLKDKFGVSWQIVPSVLSKLLQSGDAAKSKRVMDALLKMEKINVNALQQAYGGK